MTTFSSEPWSGDASGYDDAGDYCDASLINLNTGSRDQWSKGLCKMPIREPDGDVNRNAVHAAASALAGGRGGVDAPDAEKRAAARKLMDLYRQMKETPPDSLMQMAHGAMNAAIRGGAKR